MTDNPVFDDLRDRVGEDDPVSGTMIRTDIGLEDYEQLLADGYDGADIMRAVKDVGSGDDERIHIHLDLVLLAMIDDDEAREVFRDSTRWYA